MAGKGNYAKGKGPKPISSLIKAKKLEGPKKEPTEEGHPAPRVPFSAELWNEVCGLICEGYTVGEICTQPGMPSEKSVYRWMREKPELRSQFEEACLIRCTPFGEKAIEAARNARHDWTERLAFNGGTKGWEINGDALGRSKLMVDTYLRVNAQYAPKRWGQKVSQEVTGENGGPVRILSSTVKFVDP